MLNSYLAQPQHLPLFRQLWGCGSDETVAVQNSVVPKLHRFLENVPNANVLMMVPTVVQKAAKEDLGMLHCADHR